MKQILLTSGVVILFLTYSNAQGKVMKPLKELIESSEPAWKVIEEWQASATSKVEILPKDNLHADSALYAAQLSTSSPEGTIVYGCGGILIDNGLVRILGSGCERLNRSLPEWNRGKGVMKPGSAPLYTLVADDIFGGFFAINHGGICDWDINKIFYFGPNSLKWQPIKLSYSEFIVLCFSRDIEKFYEDFQWQGWENDVKNIRSDQVVSCYPLLWTREALQQQRNRKMVSIQKQWEMYNYHSKSAVKKTKKILSVN